MKYNQWLNKKPKITEDCIIITASNVAGQWYYGKFAITIKSNIVIASASFDSNIYYKDLDCDKYFLIQQL